MNINYPKYEAYKETGIQWLPRVPAGWEVKRLKYCCDSINPSKTEVRALPASTEISFLPMESVDNKGNFDLTVTKQLSEVIDGFTYFRDNDILLAKITPCFENGKGCLVTGLKNSIGFGTTEFHVLRANKSILPQHLYNHIKTTSFMNIGESEMKGAAGQKRVPQDFIENFLLALPPLSEQKEIVAFLDEKTGKIDSLLEKLKRQKELLSEKRTALITRAVTKGLNPNAPMKETGIDWLPQVPVHWEVKKLKYIGKITSGNAFNSNLFTGENTGCIAIKISNIQTMKMDWSETSYLAKDLYNKFPNFQVYKGDLIFALTRPVISSGIKVSIMDVDGKYLLNQRNALLRTHNNSHLDWMYFIMLDGQFVQHFQSIIDTTGQQPNVSPIDIGNINIPFPPEMEKKQITEYLRKQTAKIDLLQSKTDKQIELLKEYRTSLITSAVTGQIKVTDNQEQRQCA